MLKVGKRADTILEIPGLGYIYITVISGLFAVPEELKGSSGCTLYSAHFEWMYECW